MTEIAQRILFVDDEPDALSSLRRLLRPYRGGWELNFVDSAEAALQELDKLPYGVLVTDIRMPGTDGLALLQAVQLQYPELIRMVLSAYMDPEGMGRVLTLAHLVFHKPADPPALIAGITRAQRLQSTLQSGRIARSIGQITSLPPMPSIFAELQRVLAEPASGATDIARVIARDGALAAKLLRVVNSAGFGINQNIASIERAVNLLGVTQVKALTLAAESFSQFQGPAWPKDFDYEAFQERAVRRGLLAQQLCQDPRNAEQTYLAGLLMDIGELALAAKAPEIYQQVRQVSAGDEQRSLEYEQAFLGVDHAELGGYLLNLWNLPTPLVEAVAYHHAPLAHLELAGETLTPLAAVVIAETAQRTVMGDPTDAERFADALTPLLPSPLRDPAQLTEYLARSYRALGITRTAA